MHQIANVLTELCSYPENYGARSSAIGKETPDPRLFDLSSWTIVAIATMPSQLIDEALDVARASHRCLRIAPIRRERTNDRAASINLERAFRGSLESPPREFCQTP
jgi:hypothetical protein